MYHYLQAISQVQSQGYINDDTAAHLSAADMRRAVEAAGGEA